MYKKKKNTHFVLFVFGFGGKIWVHRNLKKNKILITGRSKRKEKNLYIL